jgi:hypothetical protein
MLLMLLIKCNALTSAPEMSSEVKPRLLARKKHKMHSNSDIQTNRMNEKNRFIQTLLPKLDYISVH